MQHTKSGVGSHGAHRIITCSQCKQGTDIRYMTSGSTMCNKCSKKMNEITTSDKSISNFGGDKEDNNNDDHYQEFDADDSVSQIGEKRTRKEAGLKVDEDDLGEYHKSSTAAENVIMTDTCTSKYKQQQ